MKRTAKVNDFVPNNGLNSAQLNRLLMSVCIVASNVYNCSLASWLNAQNYAYGHVTRKALWSLISSAVAPQCVLCNVSPVVARSHSLTSLVVHCLFGFVLLPYTDQICEDIFAWMACEMRAVTAVSVVVAAAAAVVVGAVCCVWLLLQSIASIHCSSSISVIQECMILKLRSEVYEEP